MSKIYNEIEIDMNPESSSFEEVIFEDSFEYDGDMMLMQEEDTWQSNPTYGYQLGGGDIEYEDLYGLFGEAGAATNREVLDYIRSVTGWTIDDIDDTQLERKMRTMPSMVLDNLKKEAAQKKHGLGLEQARSKFEQGSQALSQKLGAGRQKLATQAGMSGVRAPGQGGFAGMSDFMSEGYKQAGQLQSELGATRSALDYDLGQDVYGLQGEVEQEFADWAAMQAQDIYG